MSVRKEKVVFKDGFRSRSYCLSECAQVWLCALLAVTRFRHPSWQRGCFLPEAVPPLNMHGVGPLTFACDITPYAVLIILT